MAANDYISGAGASSYAITSMNPRLVKQQLREKMTRSVLAEAEQSKPDSAAIYKQLDGLDLHYGDKKNKTAKINQALAQYGAEFSKNPFYAFSKAGKSQISAVSNELNNPNNSQLIQRKVQDDEVLKQASTDKLVKNIQINNGNIRVLNNETGIVDWIPLDDYSKEKDSYIPLSVANEHQLIAQRGAAASAPLSVNMSSKEDVLKKMKEAFTGLGTTVTNDFKDLGSVLETIQNTSNEEQLVKAYKFLNGVGLSQQDKNTLISDYYGKNPDATYDEAEANMYESIIDYVESKKINKLTSSFKKNPGINSDGTPKSGVDSNGDPITGVMEPNRADLAVDGGYTSKLIMSFTGGSIHDEKSSDISNTVWEGGSKNYGGGIFDYTAPRDGKGNIAPTNKGFVNRTIGQNNLLNRLIRDAGPGGVKFLNQADDAKLNDTWITLPDGALQEAVYIDDGQGAPSEIQWVVNNLTGEMATASQMEELVKLEKRLEDGNLNTPVKPTLVGFFVPNDGEGSDESEFYLNRQKFLNIPVLISRKSDSVDGGSFDDLMKEHGVKRTERTTTGAVADRQQDYYRNYSNTDVDYWLDVATIASPTIMIPISNYNDFRLALGAHAYEPKNTFRIRDDGTRTTKHLLNSPEHAKAIDEALSGKPNQTTKNYTKFTTPIK